MMFYHPDHADKGRNTVQSAYADTLTIMPTILDLLRLEKAAEALAHQLLEINGSAATRPRVLFV